MSKYYYDNHDLQVLLDLLDVVHGTATCLQVLSLLDSESHSSGNNKNMDLQNVTPAQEHSCTLVDLDVEREYAIRMETILNGKICQYKHTVPFEFFFTFNLLSSVLIPLSCAVSGMRL